ncbi:N-acetylneuraminate synthase family protein [Candidatus Pelagibacter bacterium nBUS_28]|uniref:N-acetylneuraminate synthase family protein n=1 Tax=Candidatus Pelagibacter bacterium nBUS_28 TaxID=3374189 RepID=UPI003EBAED8B
MLKQKYKKPFLIAEIGINHNGSINTAKKIIDLAKKYNFDAVKFQKRNPDISVPIFQKDIMRESPWGYISYLEYKKKIEFGLKEYKIIDKYCKKKNISWFASPWDIDSVNFLKQFKCKYNKIASAMLTNLNLLKAVAKERKHTFVSVGMSKEKDIVKAIQIFQKYKCKFTLMYSVSSYPADDEDLNLLSIRYLKRKYNCDIGYSGHERTVSPTIMAYLLGASVIERHITLDRAMWGTDQAASLAEDGIKTLTETIKKSPSILGTEKFLKKKKEMDLLKKFKYWS